MWLINVNTSILEYFEGSNIPPYAILSHRWEDDEVSYQDMLDGSFLERKGYLKINSCCAQAAQDQIQYVWVDTCCIDKKSSAELSEAINSMYNWYKRSEVCYAFLSDVPDVPDLGVAKYKKAASSIWFSRGWTLQELLAPRVVRFYDQNWEIIAERSDEPMSKEIVKRTRIPIAALKNFEPDDWSIAQKMSWASHRVTTRIEDQAYCLLGLFDVFMPMLYGEGERAFARLQEELSKVSDDRSIFAWSGQPAHNLTVFGASPKAFAESAHVGKCRLNTDMMGSLSSNRFTLYNDGLLMRVDLRPLHPGYFAALIGFHNNRGLSKTRQKPVLLYLRSPPGAVSSTTDYDYYCERVSLNGNGFAAPNPLDHYEELGEEVEQLPGLETRFRKRNVMIMISRHTQDLQVVSKPYVVQSLYDSDKYGFSDPKYWEPSIPLATGSDFTFSLDWHRANYFLGCFYTFSDQGELVILSMGFDINSNPIGIWQKWPVNMGEDLQSRLALERPAGRLRISGDRTKNDLLRSFEAVLSKTEVEQTDRPPWNHDAVQFCLVRCDARRLSYVPLQHYSIIIDISSDEFRVWSQTSRTIFSSYSTGQGGTFEADPATVAKWLSSATVRDDDGEHPYFSYLDAMLKGLAEDSSVQRYQMAAIDY